MGTIAPAPKGLGSRSRKLWKSIVDKYELRYDELDLLEDVCREADLIDLLEAKLDGAPLTVRGSQGQEVINPLISELRQHRATKKQLWAALKLPDESAPGVNAQRAGGQSRWASAHGSAS